jgi:hypothetical protein
VGDLKGAYKLVSKALSEDVAVRFPNLGSMENWSLCVYTDASYGNLIFDSSTCGYIIFVDDGNGSVSPLTWHAGKVRRIVNSTLAAETLSLNEGVGHAVYLREILTTLTGRVLDITAYCDNKSIIDSLQSTKLVNDKNLRIDMAKTKDFVELENVNLVWVPGSLQLADCLTKGRAPAAKLLDCLRKGAISNE